MRSTWMMLVGGLTISRRVMIGCGVGTTAFGGSFVVDDTAFKCTVAQ